MTLRHQRFVYNANPTQVSDGSEVDALSDGYGRLVVITDASSPPTFSDPTLEALVTQSNVYLNNIDGNIFTLLIQQTDTSQISQVYSGAKGASAIAPVTSTANGTDHQGLDVVEQFQPVYEDNLNGVAATAWKPLAGTTYTASVYTNYAGSVTKALISAGSHNQFSFVATNTNAAVRWIQFHNKATAPIATDVPLLSFPVPAVGALVIGDQWFTQSGINFSLGLGWAISTTSSVFTDAATASEHTINVVWI